MKKAPEENKKKDAVAENYKLVESESDNEKAELKSVELTHI